MSALDRAIDWLGPTLLIVALLMYVLHMFATTVHNVDQARMCQRDGMVAVKYEGATLCARFDQLSAPKGDAK